MFPMRKKNNAPSRTFSAHLERHVGRSRVPLPLGFQCFFLSSIIDQKSMLPDEITSKLGLNAWF